MKHGRWLQLAAAITLLGVAALPAEPPQYQGRSYGSRAHIEEMALLDPSAEVVVRCGESYGENSVLSVDGGSLYSIDVVSSLVEGTDDGEVRSTRSTAATEGVSLLEGMITAATVEAESVTSLSKGSFEVDGSGGHFVSLVVAGWPISGRVAPNTSIPLPGVGHVVLNEQTAHIGQLGASLRVNMIHVFVTESTHLADAGTEIIVSSALSHLLASVGNLKGYGYGTAADLPNGTSQDPTALQGMPCHGTDGEVLTSTLESFDGWPAVTTGTMVSTAQGTTGPGFAVGETTSTVEDVDVLDGLVQADAVVAVARLEADLTSLDLEPQGSFVNLRIAGVAFGDDVPPNTIVPLPGFGYVLLKKQLVVNDRVTTRMIDVRVTEPNTLGLPIGTRIQVGNASVAVVD